MSERIVVDTSAKRKAALETAVGIQGASIKEWFEEQIDSALDPDLANLELWPAEIESADCLVSTPEVLADLEARDWAFTNADTSYLTHDIHPYPAKYIPQIPVALIARLSVRGDTVLDPFGGSGTSATEAVRLGRKAISVDANPLAALIGRVKSGYLDKTSEGQLDALAAALRTYMLVEKGEDWIDALHARHGRWTAEIPNLTKWFQRTVSGELSLLRHLIDAKTEGFATDVALVCLSRIVVRVSNQDSETRYVAKPKPILPGVTLKAFSEALKSVRRKLMIAAPYLRSAEAEFVVGDSRAVIGSAVQDNSVGFIVSSPPYPNATDYHLYHRFRMFWLGFDPKALASVEIGSHLKHQREKNGFASYCDDMAATLRSCFRALQPTRFAVFVVGDAMFSGEVFDTAEALAVVAKEIGYEVIGIIEREIHGTKRSFAHSRARKEKLLVLRKPDESEAFTFQPPTYKMWGYEQTLRRLEIEALVGHEVPEAESAKAFSLPLNGKQQAAATRLTFNQAVSGPGGYHRRTWQKVLENGDMDSPRRKDPKYATHGLHAYKGKFYPQLAKSLINVAGIDLGSRILDPFCGSGTVPLECFLNGYQGYGTDMNPLAAKVANAKSAILSVDRSACEDAILSMLSTLESPPKRFSAELGEFSADVLAELESWFPNPVLQKLNWLLSEARLFGDPVIVDLFEVLVSSLIRDVSQQEPTDLRVRRRNEAIVDAPVFELFGSKLRTQYNRLVHHWEIAGRMPCLSYRPRVARGDSRSFSPMIALGLQPGSVDLVVTSPPYATALPYIDTDRLSLLAVMGMGRRERSEIEESLTGSREIRRSTKTDLEDELLDSSAYTRLPSDVVDDIRSIYISNADAGVGFRRDNMPALLLRYFMDMRSNLETVHTALKTGGRAFYVVGDSRTKAGDQWFHIRTGRLLSSVARHVGFETKVLLNITVTTENFRHIKNAITENVVLEFQKVR